VLALVSFIEGYDLVTTGSLLVLAKVPLHLTDTDIRWLAVGPTFMLCLGGFFLSAASDHLSRKSIVLIGVFLTTFLTLLIPLVQTAEQLIISRLLTGIGAGAPIAPSMRWRWPPLLPWCRLSPASSPAMPTPFAFWHCRAGWR
jgi:MFS family permease